MNEVRRAQERLLAAIPDDLAREAVKSLDREGTASLAYLVASARQFFGTTVACQVGGGHVQLQGIDGPVIYVPIEDTRGWWVTEGDGDGREFGSFFRSFRFAAGLCGVPLRERKR